MSGERRKPAGEIRVAMGERRLQELRAEAARLEISEQELLRRAIDVMLGRRETIGWTAPEPHPTLEVQRAGRSVSGFVYLMQHLEDVGLFKVGFSVNPLRRLEEVSKAESAPVALVCSIPCLDMRALEADLHRRFANFRVRGEWFHLLAEHIKHLQSLAREES